MIEFTPEQLAEFGNAREEDLAKWNWERLKKEYPQRAPEVATNDKEGIAFMKRAQLKAKEYLKGQEDDRDYNRWRLTYAELAFFIGGNFDLHPWTHQILTETLWHPYQRIDVLLGVFEMCLTDNSNVEFFQKLEELS